ncbi:MAG: LysR family transcriptional regulator [Pelolinea sp.]|nr:LysR family transcriptional regulator [Pelolinea sp.]
MARIDHLKSFCLIAELHSFSLAAEAIGVSQPALSQEVKALEEGYQTELVYRKGNRITLTEDGRQVYDYALKIIALYDRSIEEVLPHKKRLNGELLIGASSGPGEFPVPVLLGMYKRQHLDVNVSLNAKTVAWRTG